MKPIIGFTLVVGFLLTTSPVQAHLTKAALEATAQTPRPTSPLPLTLPFLDENGRTRSLGEAIGATPALLLFADYTCRNLCGPMVEFASAGLRRTGLQPGRNFHFVVIGLDPKDSPSDAKKLKLAHVAAGSALFAATTFLSGDDAAVTAVTHAADYHFAYDAESDQFAHPAAAFVISPQGTVVRVLSAIGLNGGDDLRLALIEAVKGHAGSLGDQIRLLCYGFDPVQGIYTLAISRLLMVGGLLTVGTLGAGITLMARRSARERRS